MGSLRNISDAIVRHDRQECRSHLGRARLLPSRAERMSAPNSGRARSPSAPIHGGALGEAALPSTFEQNLRRGGCWCARRFMALCALLSADFVSAAVAAEIESKPARRRRTAAGDGPMFVPVDPKSCGIDFAHRWQPPPKYAGVIDRAFAGGGVAIGDADGDGPAGRRADASVRRRSAIPQCRRLAIRKHHAAAGLDGDGANWSCGATWGDIDNDGELDLFVCGFDCPNRLLINDGRAHFRESAKDAGLDFSGASVMMHWADYDRDGDLDGYLVTNRAQRGKRFPRRTARGSPRLTGGWCARKKPAASFYRRNSARTSRS